MNNEKQTDDGGAAFPHSSQPRDAQGNPMMENHTQWGMTLRDWFAGKAMVGLLAKGHQVDDELIRESLAAADAMIAARKEKV